MASHRWLRPAAIASSLLLVGGFVAYRAGAFDRYFRPAAPLEGVELEMMSGSKSDGMFDTPADYVSPTLDIPSTKWSPVITQEDIAPTTPVPVPSSPSDPVFQSSSKAMVLDLKPPSNNAPPTPPASQTANPAPPATEAQSARAMIQAGSKSSPAFGPSDFTSRYTDAPLQPVPSAPNSTPPNGKVRAASKGNKFEKGRP